MIARNNATGAAKLADYGISIKPGVHQYAEKLWKRPSGTFSKIRLEVFFRGGGDGSQNRSGAL